MRTYLSAVIVHAALMAAMALGDPATRPALGETDIGNYCTVLLAPKLLDHLAVSDSQRDLFSDLKTKLKSQLAMAAGGPVHGPLTPGLIAARAQTVLDRIGHEVRDVLNAEQETTLVKMFDDQTLQPIQVNADVDVISHWLYRGETIVSGVNLAYTHYGESAPAQLATRPSPVARRVPRNAGATLDLAGALRLLATDEQSTEARGAQWLAEAQPDLADRVAVVSALKPRLNQPDAHDRQVFVEALANWADQDDVPTLMGVVEFPADPPPMSGHEPSWATAVAALARLDAAAAKKAVGERISNFFFRVDAMGQLKPLASGYGPTAQTARQLVQWLQHPDQEQAN
jgi:hypothetical protein